MRRVCDMHWPEKKRQSSARRESEIVDRSFLSLAFGLDYSLILPVKSVTTFLNSSHSSTVLLAQCLKVIKITSFFEFFLLNHKYFLFISIIFQIFEFARQKWTKLSNYTFWGIFKQCGFRERILLLLLGKKIFSIFAPWQLSLTCVFQLCFTWRHETSWDTQFFIHGAKVFIVCPSFQKGKVYLLW